jgi:hypothetical protein
MKNLIALFSKKTVSVSIASFSSDVLTLNQLATIRGGGEPAQAEMLIVIPPKQK